MVDKSAQRASGAQTFTGVADTADPNCYTSLPMLTVPPVRSKRLMSAIVTATVRWYFDC